MIEIHGRQSSHYTRLVRLLAHELDVPCVLVPIHDLLSGEPAAFHEIVAQRPPDAASRKRRASLESTLDWLDANLRAVSADLPHRPRRWFDLALFALLEHFPFRNPTIDVGRRPALQAFVTAFGARPSARATPYAVDPAPTPPSPAAGQVAR